MKHKEENFISAVIYVSNAEKQVGTFLKVLHKTLTRNFRKFEIICVDDSSTDNSATIVRKQAEKLKDGAIVLITTGFHQGIESSMLAGVDFASGDFVYEFDKAIADYDMNLIIDVYNRCQEGFDIVSATSNSRSNRTSQLFYKVFNSYSKTQYKLQSESFRIISRRAINRASQLSTTIPYRKAIYANSGLKYDNITYQQIKPNLPVPHEKQSFRQDLAFDSFIIFTDLTYKISLAFTFFMMTLAIAVAAYAIYIFMEGSPVEGWTTTMMVLSIGLFGIFGVLSIMIKYLSVIINLIFKKTKYTIRSIEKL